jgi:hypothetical protein
MQRDNERIFVQKRIVPLLQRLGFQNVRVTHGLDEYGRDVVFTDTDRFGMEKWFAVQAKFGDVSGAAGADLDKILAQVDDAFRMPFADIRDGTEKFISGLYIAISGRFARNAKEKMRRKCLGKQVYFFDGTQLDQLEALKPRSVLRPAGEERKRLTRQAQAAMRCRPENLQLFEQKLHEIDLLEDCEDRDKIEAVAHLGLEVSLNSDKGTQLLVDQLMWHMALWDSPSMVDATLGRKSAKGSLTLIASSLWEIGLQSVEYGRSSQTVERVLGALAHAAGVAAALCLDAARRSCARAVQSMYEQAKSDGKHDIASVIQSSSLLQVK